MRSTAVWFVGVLCALAVAGCGGGGGSYATPATPTPVPAPAATVAAQSIALPTAPPAGTTVAVTLPAPGGITPSLSLGSGYAAGTQLVVSAANYGQTSALVRRPASTFTACPVLVDLTAYVSLPLPTASLAAFSVTFGNALTFLGAGTFTTSIYDAGSTQTSGNPPAPATDSTGCAVAPATTSVLAAATGTVSGGTVTFTNFVSNPNLSSTLASKYNLSASGGGAIPAGAVFGFYVAYVAAATPSPSATATPTSTPTASPTLATATLLGSAGFVTSSGRTAYILSNDTTSSLACTVASGCTGVWPVIAPPNGVALSAGFSVYSRSDNGASQLAYNGHPLYTYAGDSANGQTNGNGIVSFGGTWTVARP